MNDHADFLRAICEDPTDVGLRLVYADWLDERADPLGEFIRVQCELKEFPPDYQAAYDITIAVGPERVMDMVHRMTQPTVVEGRLAKYIELRLRQKELLNSHGLSKWTPDLLIQYVRGRDAFHRGFIEVATCSINVWLAYGPQIVTTVPIRRVEITDREPLAIQDRMYTWYRMVIDGEIVLPHWLPNRLFDPLHYVMILPGETCSMAFDSRQSAMDYLSRVCVAWARYRAGLSTLMKV